MAFYNLSLPYRLGLAAASALLPQMVYLADDRLLSMPDFLVFSSSGASLALLVLLPIVSASSWRLLRAAVLIVTAVSAQALAIWLSLETYDSLGLDWLVIVPNVLLATLLISIVTAMVAPIKLTARYIAYTSTAGLIAGFSMWYLLAEKWQWFCNADYPCPWWNTLYEMAGWVIWNSLICISIFYGRRHESSA